MKKLAVVSDTHGEFRLVSEALSIIQSLDITTILHCGDVGGDCIVSQFALFDAYFVRGNTDVEESLKREVESAGLTYCYTFGAIKVEDVQIGFTHGHSSDLFKKESDSGRWNLICYGHTHQQDYSILPNGTLLLNPGAFARVARPSFAVVTVEGEQIRVEHFPF